ncbi:MAG: hypothetical protein M5R41_04575 [Bacteroidia bacterium]|nr:hypothetical protein [Bacteroidia bacterium]
MKSFCFTSLFLLLSTVVAAQTAPDSDILATVNGEAITVGEFRSRYALTVFPLKDRVDLTGIVKRHFLYALVAERLLAAEARRLGLAEEDRFVRNYRLAEEAFVRDKLYRDSVRAVVRITDEDILSRYLEEESEIEVEFLLSPDEGNIRNLHRLIMSGVSFDTLLVEQQNTGMADSLRFTQPVETESPLLRAAATLQAGAVSAPLLIDGFWYLLRKREHGNPIRTRYELEKQGRRIEADLRREREAVRTVAFVQSCWRGDTARMNETAYRRIGEALLREYRAQAAADTADMLLARSETFEELRAQFAKELEQPFAVVRQETLCTIGEVLDRLEALDLRLKREDVRTLPQLFAQRVRDVLDRMMLVRLGYALRLEQSNEVRRDMAGWVSSGLAQMLPDVLWEQFIASDDSVWQYYITHPELFGPFPEVLLLEVLSADQETSAEVKRRVEAGEDIRSIAGRESLRDGATERGGVFGWFSVAQQGILGRGAFGLTIGERAGPFRGPDGWSYFELLGKRRLDAGIQDWSALRRAIAARAREGVERRKIEDMLREHAGKANLRMHEDVLERTEVPAMQMFTIRHLGFGGRIPAAPAVMPLHEAVMEGLSRGAELSPP